MSYDQYGGHDHEHDPLQEEWDKFNRLVHKLGFSPQGYFSTAGVTMGTHKQFTLKLASAFATARTTLTLANDGIRLGREPSNKFDEWAIQVWLATRMVDGKLTGHQHVGYIPRRLCTYCWKSFGGKDAGVNKCPFCNMDLSNQMLTYFNRFLAQNYMDVGRGIWLGVYWIAQSSKETSRGCRMAFLLPPAQLRPPNV